MNQQKRAIIIGATSGIGKAITLTLLKKGWKVGIAGRREALLADIQKTAPDAVVYQVLDVTADDAAENLDRLIGKLGGMDLFLYSSGYGFTNLSLELQIEKDTVQTNVVGFVSLIHKAFHFFREQQYGHLAAITSVAGTRGIGLAASYSATKRFQTTYLSALSQLVKNEKYAITVTDIQPGFVKTDFITGGYPLQMDVEYVAKKIVKGLKKKRRKIVIDERYRLIICIWLLLPRCLWERLKLISFVRK
ncbi:MAG: SDR family NAD(P)-dependent oxidoreductase [Bacteroidales bacterium]|jgi:short-subunit dehydrogenase